MNFSLFLSFSSLRFGEIKNYFSDQQEKLVIFCLYVYTQIITQIVTLIERYTLKNLLKFKLLTTAIFSCFLALGTSQNSYAMEDDDAQSSQEHVTRQLDVAALLNQDAIQSYEIQNYQGGIVHSRQAIAILKSMIRTKNLSEEDLAEANYGLATARHNLAVSHNDVGELECKKGSYEDAVPHYRKAIHNLVHIMEIDELPEEDLAEAKQGLAIAQYNFATCLKEMGFQENQEGLQKHKEGHYQAAEYFYQSAEHLYQEAIALLESVIESAELPADDMVEKAKQGLEIIQHNLAASHTFLARH